MQNKTEKKKKKKKKKIEKSTKILPNFKRRKMNENHTPFIKNIDLGNDLRELDGLNLSLYHNGLVLIFFIAQLDLDKWRRNQLAGVDDFLQAGHTKSHVHRGNLGESDKEKKGPCQPHSTAKQ